MTSIDLKLCSVLRSCVTDGTGQGCAAASKNLRQSVTSEFTVNSDAIFSSYKTKITNIVKCLHKHSLSVAYVSLGIFLDRMCKVLQRGFRFVQRAKQNRPPPIVCWLARAVDISLNKHPECPNRHLYIP